ncbi:hippurate hydrolase [Paraburkholderia tropica]|uniref:M20 family metallopeptidase n=1 Tax=Paraburkholderia tropica TaxID=92647 RepID=UPI00161E2C31|nr:M20 family metallopeptidase [Paraburkholderia tropica]MBB3001381.1 hippurate hydrolase [Paraburkholderia tropica]MBB6323343.1 hippurate hydrolase [Paraburkholderia tropica]
MSIPVANPVSKAVSRPLVETVAPAVDALLPELEAVYKDLHQHPELSMQEFRTAKIAADYVEALGYEVTREVGVTGVVAILRNGEGPTVMLRADMDALPVTEATGLPYASSVTAKDDEGVQVGVAHACGHDLHVTWLMGAARLFAQHRDAWRGTLMCVFQPGEEVGRGARSMIDDGMIARFPKPDVILGQHVMVGAAGTVGYRSGTILSAGDSLKVKLFGRGSHGSQPQTSIDPVIMAASTTLRLQTIVSREISPRDSAVLTVGALQAGTKENIIPDDATLKLNMRTYDEDVREYMLGAIRRICCAECMASNAPREPEFTTLSSYPLTVNDDATTARLRSAFEARFGARAYETQPAAASEDFSVFGREWGVPYAFWFIGGTDPETFEKAKTAKKINEIPSNHSPKFAPVLDGTLRTGLEAMLCAAAAWLDHESEAA